MSEIKVNKISPRTNCGTTTLGDSGDTFTIPSGVTITNNGTANGFGATGSVNWQTTVKTSGFTATAGEGYFVDTTSGSITVNLPAGTAGAVVGFKDYANTFDSNNLKLAQNGSDKIGGSTDNAILSAEGLAVTLVFIDSTKGWLVTDSGLQSEAPTEAYVAATGGSIVTCGNFKIHTFTGPGTFQVTCAGTSSGSNTVDYLVVAGGGGGGYDWGGGAGGGGVRASATTFTNAGPSSPRTPTSGPTAVAALPVAVASYPVTVGGGGAGGIESSSGPNGGGQRGTPSSFVGSSTITSTGGGGGKTNGSTPQETGGSGGGARTQAPPNQAGGAGNTPPVSPPQGEPGGESRPYPGGSPPHGGPAGGGGFMQVGQVSTAYGPGGPGTGGVGGAGGGFPSDFGSNGVPCGSYRYYAGGGGGGDHGGGGGGAGGLGGGGAGGTGGPGDGVAGTANTGGGGGGAPNCGAPTRDGGNGGSGIVVIRYRFQA